MLKRSKPYLWLDTNDSYSLPFHTQCNKLHAGVNSGGENLGIHLIYLEDNVNILLKIITKKQ